MRRIHTFLVAVTLAAVLGVVALSPALPPSMAHASCFGSACNGYYPNQVGCNGGPNPNGVGGNWTYGANGGSVSDFYSSACNAKYAHVAIGAGPAAQIAWEINSNDGTHSYAGYSPSPASQWDGVLLSYQSVRVCGGIWDGSYHLTCYSE